MSLRLLYIVGRNADFAGIISCRNGQLILNLPNYHKVHDHPVNPKMVDEFCFCIKVPEDKIKEVLEREGPVLRVWDGPKDSNQYPQYKVRADVFNMETPLAAGAKDPAMVGEMQDLKTEIAKLKEIQAALITERDEARKVAVAGNEAITQVEEDVKAANAIIAQLRDELVQARSGNVIREVDAKVLAEVIRQAPEKVLEKMPHCGPDTVSHFKHWAMKFLTDEG